MHHPDRAQIAQRIHVALVHELGQGIELERMLRSALYARDVLLVCQAYPGSELQRLGRQFALAETEPTRQPGTPPSGWRRDGSGFGTSKPVASGGFADFDDLADADHGARQATRRWLAPSTWFAR